MDLLSVADYCAIVCAWIVVSSIDRNGRVSDVHAVPPAPLASSVAGQWFGIRVVCQKVTPWWTVWAVVKNCVLLVVTLGLSMDWYEPKRFCDVIVYRFDTGATVLRYDYKSPEEAGDHVVSLSTRLAETQVFDFCRELGVSMSEVVGEGQQLPLTADSLDVPRLEVSSSHRYENPFS